MSRVLYLTRRIRRIVRIAATTIVSQYASLALLRDRRLAILALANVFDTMSATIFVPLLPSLADELGASGVVIGLIFTAPAIVSAVVTPPAGYISDRVGRRPLIATGMTLSAVPVVAIAFAWSPVVLILLRSLDALLRGIVSPATTAYLGDTYDASERGEAFGAYHTSSMVGAAAGPALGGLLADIGGVRFPFVVLGGGTLFGGLLLVVFLPAVETNDVNGADSSGLFPAVSRESLAAFLSMPMVAWLLTASIDEFGSNALNPTFPLLLQETIGRGPTYVGTTYSALALAMLIFLPIGGKATDQLGRIRVLLISYMGWCVVMGGLATTTIPLVPPLLMFLGGVLSAFAAPASFALLYEIAPDGREATFSGITEAAESLGKAAGPLFAGIVMSLWGVQFAVIVAGLSWLIAVPLLLFVVPQGVSANDNSQFYTQR
jgi:MFS family permease